MPIQNLQIAATLLEEIIQEAHQIVVFHQKRKKDILIQLSLHVSIKSIWEGDQEMEEQILNASMRGNMGRMDLMLSRFNMKRNRSRGKLHKTHQRKSEMMRVKKMTDIDKDRVENMKHLNKEIIQL